MPKLTKCWYKDCDSDNRQQPKLFFYKFPRDLDRCEKWVRNCANDELTIVWNESPDKISALRICQKHFLKEFLGSSSRLVGHAVPAPYGVPMDSLNAERFMVDCASLKSSTSLARQTIASEPNADSLQPYQQEQQCSLPYYDNSLNDQTMVNMYPSNCDVSNTNYSYQNYGESSITDNNYFQVSTYDQQQASSSNQLINPTGQANYNQTNSEPSHQADCQPFDSYNPNSSNAMTAVHGIPPDVDQYSGNYQQDTQHLPPVSMGNDIAVYQRAEPSTSIQTNDCEYNNLDYQQDQSMTIAAPSSSVSRLNHQENPKISYDRDGNVISIQYSTQTMSLMQTNDKAQSEALVEALKQKLRYYQRKLAVKNHRYQKLRSLTKVRSNKTRLLESLKTCEGDFSPCIFEIFKRQIKGPSSKHGNRWSDEVKFFASAIYLRSKSAYKFIRKSIDLPSESIVKRYIDEKNLSKSLPNELDDEDQNELKSG